MAAADADSGVKVPLMSILVTLLLALWLMRSTACDSPLATGVQVRLMTQDSPGARVSGHSDLNAKPAWSGASSLMAETVTLSDVRLRSSTERTIGTPPVDEPKSRSVGDASRSSLICSSFCVAPLS